MSESNSASMEPLPLSDVVSVHIQSCPTCQDNLTKPPVSNLNPTGRQVCSELTLIFQFYADWEGAVNNIVSHDEYGNDANA